MNQRGWRRSLMVVLTVPLFVLSAAGSVQAAPSPGCVSDWWVSYGGISSWTLVHTDPDGLPLSDLYFSRSYNDPTDFSRGYLDFDHSGRSDVFSAVPMGDGNYQWRYVAPGPGITSTTWSDWINLAHDSTPPDQLRFGDFNGDGYTDVFSTVPIDQFGDLQWRVSLSGTLSYDANPAVMAFDSTPLDQLRFGDFNGDGKTDVFALRDLGPGQLGWEVSYSGTTNYAQINMAPTPLSEMQFGDINADGHTDVFTTLPSAAPGKFDWKYSSAGSSPYQFMVTKPQSVHDVILAGNFDGDHATDFFYTTVRQDGKYQWWYFDWPSSAPSSAGDFQLAFDSTPPDQLRFGDFNGDGITDVFKLVRRCSVDLPLVQH